MASPATSMTSEAALKRLMRYAKVFGSDPVLEQLTTFTDRVICQYLARELLEVSEQLEKVRQQLRLADECCEDVLNRPDFVQSVMNWHRTDPSTEDIKYLTPPTSINDGDAARLQLEEKNILVDDRLTIYAVSLMNIQNWTEAARANAHNPEGKRYQAAAENEKVVKDDKYRNIFREYAEWCPYLQQFCEALLMFGEDVADKSIVVYMTCCEQTMKVIDRLTKELNLNADHKEYLRERHEVLEQMTVTLLARHQRASKALEELEKEQEKEGLLRERLERKSDDDFWEECDRLSSEALDPLERRVLLEERERRKALKAQGATRDSWRGMPAMTESDGQGPREKGRDKEAWPIGKPRG
jgi:hypothetical protein